MYHFFEISLAVIFPSLWFRLRATDTRTFLELKLLPAAGGRKRKRKTRERERDRKRKREREGESEREREREREREVFGVQEFGITAHGSRNSSLGLVLQTE